MALVIRPLDDRSEAAWDAFVEAHPDGTFFHRAGWASVIAAAFGHKPIFLLAEQDGAIVGVLPLAQVKTALFGNTLISVPFCVYGGAIASDPATRTALERHASALLGPTGASAVELRYRDPVETDWLAGPDLYVTFRKAISADHDANMKAIPRKQRAMVRKGIQYGLTSVANQDIDTLHRVYAESVRNLGTPVFPRRYFAILASVFHDCLDVVIILDEGAPVASVMNFYFREEVLPYYGGGTRDARNRAANDFMYWEVMRRAGDKDYRLFDFGRSKRGTGAFAFKHNWGFEPAPLHYRFALKRGATIPDHNPMNPKYRLFIEGWKRLPLPLANLLGPHIVRGVG